MRGGLILVSVCILLGGAAANYLRYVEPTPPQPVRFDQIPYQTDSYTGEERFFDEQSYEVLGADSSTLRIYRDDEGRPLWLFIGYFQSQKYGSQIHSPKHCLPGSGWRITNLEPFELEIGSGPGRTINRVEIVEGNREHLMFYWFETRGGTIRNEFGLKWDLMLNSLSLRPTDAAMIRLNLPVDAGESRDETTARAVEFLEEYMPSIEKALPFGN